MSTEKNKSIVRRIYESNESLRDMALFDATYVPEYVHHDAALPPELQNGLENYKQVHHLFLSAFPDMEGTLEDQVAEGDRVVSRLTFRGTHRGELMGIPPSGRKVELAFISIHRLSAGKVVEGWVSFDALGMMRQIGAIPAPGEAPVAAAR